MADHDQLICEAIDAVRELNARHRALNDDRKQIVGRFRKAGLDLESIKRVAKILDEQLSPEEFENGHNRLRNLLDKYSDFSLARDMHSRAGVGAHAHAGARAREANGRVRELAEAQS